MKTYYFNIQAKGGAGKSVLTYLQALKNESNPDSLFVDLDGSTKTSMKQLKFLKEDKRIAEISITDNIKRIEREKLFKVLEALNCMNFNEIYLDFGAPESEQLPNLFTMDFTADEFKEFEGELESKFVFNIVVSGGPAYRACMEYAGTVSEALEGLFEVYLYVNEYSFQPYPQLLEEIQANVAASDLIAGVRVFGDIRVDRESGKNVLEFMKEGKGMKEYSGFATKIVMRRELEKV